MKKENIQAKVRAVFFWWKMHFYSNTDSELVPADWGVRWKSMSNSLFLINTHGCQEIDLTLHETSVYLHYDLTMIETLKELLVSPRLFITRKLHNLRTSWCHGCFILLPCVLAVALATAEPNSRDHLQEMCDAADCTLTVSRRALCLQQ